MSLYDKKTMSQSKMQSKEKVKANIKTETYGRHSAILF